MANVDDCQRPVQPEVVFEAGVPSTLSPDRLRRVSCSSGKAKEVLNLRQQPVPLENESPPGTNKYSPRPKSVNPPHTPFESLIL